MSINPPDKLPKAPDYMTDYREDEKTLARQKQAEHRDNKNTMPWYKKRVVKVAGAILTVTGIGITVAATQGGESSSVSTENGADKPIDNGITANGNEYPSKVNPDYDKTYGIYGDLGTTGSFSDTQDTLSKWGIKPVVLTAGEAETISESYTELMANDNFEAINERKQLLNKYVPTLEAALNVLNMNNSEAQSARSLSEDLSEDEQIVLTDADLPSAITQVLAEGGSNVPALQSENAINSMIGSIPNDASLRALICPFTGEVPVACKSASQDNLIAGTFSLVNDFEDETGKAVQYRAGLEGDESAPRFIRSDFKLNVLWMDPKGEISSATTIEFTVDLGSTSSEDVSHALNVKDPSFK